MANTYDVGDRVKIELTRDGVDYPYEAYVITYFEDDLGDVNYVLSVTGRGDTVIAKEDDILNG